MSLTSSSAQSIVTTDGVADRADAPGGRIDCDLSCAECGYNLRTQGWTSNCPECGMSVITSARHDRLVDTPIHYRQRLVTGSRWLKYAVVLAFLLVYPGVLVSCVALWYLTGREPDRIEPTLDRSFRQSARWLGMIGGAAMVILSYGALIAMGTSKQQMFGNWDYQGLPLFDMAFLLSHAVWVLGMLSVWRHLRILAQRIPDPDLAGRFNRLGRGWLLAVLLFTGLSGMAYALNQVGVLPQIVNSTLFGIEIIAVMFVLLVALWMATLRVVNRQLDVFQTLIGSAKEATSGGADPG